MNLYIYGENCPVEMNRVSQLWQIKTIKKSFSAVRTDEMHFINLARLTSESNMKYEDYSRAALRSEV